MHDRLYAIRARYQAITAPIRRRIPSLPVVFYAHPFELAFGFVLVVSGLRAFVSGESSPSINDALPPAVLTAFQIVGFIAGVALLTGLAFRRHSLGRAVERLGTIFAAGTYAGYAIILAATVPLTLAWSTLNTAGAVALAFWIRGKTIRRTDLTILRALRSANLAEDRADTAELIRRLVDQRIIDEREGRL